VAAYHRDLSAAAAPVFVDLPSRADQATSQRMIIASSGRQDASPQQDELDPEPKRRAGFRDAAEAGRTRWSVRRGAMRVDGDLTKAPRQSNFRIITQMTLLSGAASRAAGSDEREVAIGVAHRQPEAQRDEVVVGAPMSGAQPRVRRSTFQPHDVTRR
jgi:hypothetical protein